jgi:hypothetical protein
MKQDDVLKWLVDALLLDGYFSFGRHPSLTLRMTNEEAPRTSLPLDGGGGF